MRKGKYAKKANFSARPIVLLFALVLLAGMAVGGTVAWLTDTTEEVVNTFTVGNIDIDLSETKTDFKMVPGTTIDKDPVVTVKANSEASWVFVKVEESDNLDDFITYTIAEDWTALTDADEDGYADDGVYYIKQDELTAEGAEDATYNVLACKENPADSGCTGCVLVNDTVTKDMMDEITDATAEEPTLTFTAYAVQLYKDSTTEFTAAEAWVLAQDSSN